MSQIIGFIKSGVRTNDTSKVACSEISEFAYIRDHLLPDHVKAPQSTEQLDKAIKEICHEMGSSNHHKLREVFQYLLIEILGLSNQYLKNIKPEEQTNSSTNNESTDSKENRLDRNHQKTLALRSDSWFSTFSDHRYGYNWNDTA